MLAKILTAVRRPNIQVSVLEVAFFLLGFFVSPWFYALMCISSYYAYH